MHIEEEDWEVTTEGGPRKSMVDWIASGATDYRIK
jgi:hypothetical protein